MNKISITALFFAASVFAADELGNPGLLSTEFAQNQERYQLGIGLQNRLIWDKDIWKDHQMLDGKDYRHITESFLTEHHLGASLSLRYGFRISADLPVYYEDVKQTNAARNSVDLGDMRVRATWQTPDWSTIPWLKGLLAVGTDVPTSSRGEGWYPRELEYATTESGCFLYGCGSRNTGLDLWFSNVDLRAGVTADLLQSKWNLPWTIAFNISNRKTALGNSDVGPYTVKDQYFYDIFAWSLATTYRTPWYGLGLFGEYLHEARWENEWPKGADRHDLSLGLNHVTKNGIESYLGMTFGIANDAYANATYATDKGRDALAYGFKTPDWSVIGGVSYHFSIAPDEDGDGVKDYQDQCPHTPPHVAVDAHGCPLDADKDNVPDYEDQCPNTPAGEKVNAVGCPLDSDGDGVIDALDQCPNTPAGRKVDALGCELDSDHDGVVDALDQCPNTPAGRKVDALGCELDSDHDGVVDALDQCPNTPQGFKVDARGCVVDSDGDGVPDNVDQCPKTLKGQAVDSVGCVAKDRDLSSLQQGIQFELGSDKLAKSSQAVLDNVVAVLKDVPATKLEVQGHSSRENPDKDSLNTVLSQKRAEAVVKYLVNKGIASERLLAKGYGPSVPIADNATEEGRVKNRRVELVILEGGK